MIKRDADVGKTHLLKMFAFKELPKKSTATICIEFLNYEITLDNGETVKAQIWDTAGQVKYRTIAANHLFDADGAIIVYNICNKKTFDNVNIWLELLEEHCERNIIKLLAGNKYDLVTEDNNERAVEYADAEELSKKNDMIFYETSALTNYNVTAIFKNIAQEIINRGINNFELYNESTNLNANSTIKNCTFSCCSLT